MMIAQLESPPLAPPLVDPSKRFAPMPGERIGPMPSHLNFAALRAVFRLSGGLARGDDLGRLLEDRKWGNFVTFAKLVDGREVFGFEWRHAFWVPMFQFELCDLYVKPEQQRVLAEPVKVFDNWTIAIWLAQPNSWLADQRPVDLLHCNLAAVVQAARADRFVARG